MKVQQTVNRDLHDKIFTTTVNPSVLPSGYSIIILNVSDSNLEESGLLRTAVLMDGYGGYRYGGGPGGDLQRVCPRRYCARHL